MYFCMYVPICLEKYCMYSIKTNTMQSHSRETTVTPRRRGVAASVVINAA